MNATDKYEGHGGIITGLSFHPQSSGSYNFSNLFLTSSIDWTVKLWRTKVNLIKINKIYKKSNENNNNINYNIINIYCYFIFYFFFFLFSYF